MADGGGSESLEGMTPLRMSKKTSKVRNKAPAQVQITAEQLLREAKERDLEIVAPPPRQNLRDPAELEAYQIAKRKEYEDGIRKNRLCIANWIKYAKWEDSQKQFQRARSIFERGLDVEHRNISMWLQYAEFEMRNKQINHARNLWNRAVTIQPRVKQFWLKYSYMEEVLGNLPGARQVFERWMEWEPDEQAWLTYINFENRHREIERVRDIYQRFLHIHHDPRNWIRYAKFEERNGYVENARHVYERAVEFFGEENMDENVLKNFARFEENQKEHERARVIYRYALDTLPKAKTDEIFKSYTIHEKKYGERVGIEGVIVSKRKAQYEQQIEENALNYDAWFDYLRLLENEANDPDAVRECYERAIANVPLEPQKRFWRRYIYIWIKFALFEETEMKDMDRARNVYKACLDLIPHKKFTFAKMWLYFAQFEIRQRNLTTARKILGTAIGKCPKDKLFRGYIDLEIQLREFDRCRILYEKFLQFSPENCTTWIKFAEMETLLGDVDRARAIFELAIKQPMLDMPEVLWKSYIDFEVSQEEFDYARNLYKRLLNRTQHVKVWVSFAQFEAKTGETEALEAARNVYRKAKDSMKENGSEKEERLMLLEAWKAFEKEFGTEDTIKKVDDEFPRRVKKRRPLLNDEGQESGWEEYYDYIFPSDESSQANLKLLAMAKAWKQKQALPNLLPTASSESNEASSSAAPPPPDSTTTTSTTAPDDDQESAAAQTEPDSTTSTAAAAAAAAAPAVVQPDSNATEKAGSGLKEKKKKPERKKTDAERDGDSDTDLEEDDGEDSSSSSSSSSSGGESSSASDDEDKSKKKSSSPPAAKKSRKKK